MKNFLMLLSCAALLTTASCSRDNQSANDAAANDTSANGGAAGTGSAGTSGTAAMGGYSDADYNSRADRIAADMATRMKLDEAIRTKVRTAYYNRSKRLGELRQQYQTDTAGMAAAMREVYTETDTEMKSIFTDPQQYSAYESSRPEYIEDRYVTTEVDATDDNASAAEMEESAMNEETGMATTTTETTTTTTTENRNMNGSAMSGGSGSMNQSSAVSVQKMKAKSAAGDKMKVKSDGDVKVKDRAGNKAKVDADDVTLKEKAADGSKTVIK